MRTTFVSQREKVGTRFRSVTHTHTDRTAAAGDGKSEDRLGEILLFRANCHGNPTLGGMSISQRAAAANFAVREREMFNLTSRGW